MDEKGTGNELSTTHGCRTTMRTRWTPRADGTAQVCGMLAQAQRPEGDQSQALLQLQQCSAQPEFPRYLAYVFAAADDQANDVRQSAGLLLKNHLKGSVQEVDAETMDYVKCMLLPCLHAKERTIRQTAATATTAIVARRGVADWPELLSHLCEMLDAEDKETVAGALDTVYKLCEDAPMELEKPVQGLGDWPLNLIVPRLMAKFGSPEAEFRRDALACVNLVVGYMPSALQLNLDLYLQGLFALAKDADNQVRKHVCNGLVQLMEVQPEKLMPFMKDVIEYMLGSTQESDAGIALESCEFWSAFCEADLPPEEITAQLGGFIPRLIPVLLKNMAYSDDDEEVIAAEMDEEEEDKESDIRPFIAQSSEKSASDVKSSGAEGEGEEEEDEDEGYRSWNLRKSSAAGLDVLSNVFGDDLLPIMMPIVEQMMQQNDWRYTESAILALGAVAEGCAMGLFPHLNEIVRFILPQVNHPHPLVRSISCWCLSRYSRWMLEVAQRPDGEATGAKNQLGTVFNAVLSRMAEKNKIVQKAACSAICTMAEECAVLLGEWSIPILQHTSTALGMYGKNNLRIVYELLAIVADSMGARMREGQYAELILPPLIRKWQSTPFTDREILPILQCMTSIALALGPRFEAAAPAVYSQSCMLLQMQLECGQDATGGYEADADYLSCALDLLSSFADGMGPSAEPLFASNADFIREALLVCCCNPSQTVRQSAFALVGDLAKCCYQHIAPRADHLVTSAIQNLQPQNIQQHTMSACNNACWSLGEIAVRATPEQVQAFAPSAAQVLLPIIRADVDVKRSVAENASIALGRIAKAAPDVLAPSLQDFISPWCLCMRSLRDGDEKESAFLGLCAVVRLNASAALPSFRDLCHAVASWKTVPCEGLHNEFHQLLHAFKSHLSSQGLWEQAWQTVDPAAQEKLRLAYSL